MTIKNRAQNQIRTVISVFEKVQVVFNQGQPVDNWLSSYFRANKKLGSKDRKRIANSIFGYFRWYGWIGRHKEDNISRALLLGYTLDDNKPDQTIQFWAEQHDLDISTLRKSSLEEKKTWISNILRPVEFIDLNPDFVPELPLDFLQKQQKRASLWIRLTNTTDKRFLKELDRKNISYSVHPEQKTCIEINSPVNLHEFSQFKKGLLEVQDIASQGVGYICKPRPSEVWWDVCAGSGGKALHLASLANNKGKVYATEVRKARFHELTKRINRSDFKKSIEAIYWDGKKIPTFSKHPIHAIVDAPCSCSGTWRRSPELRWSITKDKIGEYSHLQLDILKRVAQVVPTGGKLVYVTCSIFEEENEMVVNKFLEIHSGFSLQPILCPFTKREYFQGIHFRTPEVDGNAMFAAVMIKQNN